MAEVTLLLGSNLGDRESNIRSALNLLDIAFGARPSASSTIISTEACGFDGPEFLNCIVRYKSGKSPRTVLSICKSIEKKLGRSDVPEYDAEGKRIYHDRIIDIDILYYGNLRMESPELTIPHPQIETRPFVRKLLDSVR